MSDLKLTVKNLKKVFNRRLVFNNLNFELNNGQSLIVTGKNGSGKSTLIKILSGYLTESSGKIEYQINGKMIDRENFYQIVGLVSPYLVLYEEFSAFENLQLISKIRGLKISEEKIKDVLNFVGLFDRRNDLVRTYSSGMKQRIKYASAILHSPSVLLLDEPTSNLDLDGKEIVEKLVDEYRDDKILIVATNESQDFKFGDHIINLDDYKINNKST